MTVNQNVYLWYLLLCTHQWHCDSQREKYTVVTRLRTKILGNDGLRVVILFTKLKHKLK